MAKSIFYTTLSFLLLFNLSAEAQDFSACHDQLRPYAVNWDPHKSVGSDIHNSPKYDKGDPRAIKPWPFHRTSEDFDDPTVLGYFLSNTGRSGELLNSRIEADRRKYQPRSGEDWNNSKHFEFQHNLGGEEPYFTFRRCFDVNMAANRQMGGSDYSDTALYLSVSRKNIPNSGPRAIESARLSDSLRGCSWNTRTVLKQKTSLPDHLNFKYHNGKCYVESVSGNSRFNYDTCYKVQEILKPDRNPSQPCQVSSGTSKSQCFKKGLELIKEVAKELGANYNSYDGPLSAQLRSYINTNEATLKSYKAKFCQLYTTYENINGHPGGVDNSLFNDSWQAEPAAQ